MIALSESGSSESAFPNVRRVRVNLPIGLRGTDGRLRRCATLREARARDELAALGDFRARLYPDALPRLLLARVVESFDDVEPVGLAEIERLDDVDLEALTRAYAALNDYSPGAQAFAGSFDSVVPTDPDERARPRGQASEARRRRGGAA